MTLREATAIGSVIGDSVSIEPAVTIHGRDKRPEPPWLGAKIATRPVAGRLDRLADMVWKTTLGQRPKLYFLDGQPTDDVHAAAFPSGSESSMGAALAMCVPPNR